MVKAPAFIAEAMNFRNKLETVIPTPVAKLAQTAAFVTLFQYRPYMNGARKEPAKAPQDIQLGDKGRRL